MLIDENSELQYLLVEGDNLEISGDIIYLRIESIIFGSCQRKYEISYAFPRQIFCPTYPSNSSVNTGIKIRFPCNFVGKVAVFSHFETNDEPNPFLYQKPTRILKISSVRFNETLN